MRLLAVPLAAAVALALGWRRLSRRRRLPCPFWLSWSLDNPVRNRFWNPPSLLNRAGIAAGQRVLEVGPGIGYYTLPLADAAGAGGSVVCLDLQPAMLAALRQRLAECGVRNVHLIRGDATRLPFRPGVFDRSVLITVLGEIPERRVALAEQARALRQDGLLAVGEQFPDPHYQSQRTVKSLAIESGLRVVEWRAWTPGHLTLLAPNGETDARGRSSG